MQQRPYGGDKCGIDNSFVQKEISPTNSWRETQMSGNLKSISVHNAHFFFECIQRTRFALNFFEHTP